MVVDEEVFSSRRRSCSKWNPLFRPSNPHSFGSVVINPPAEPGAPRFPAAHAILPFHFRSPSPPRITFGPPRITTPELNILLNFHLPPTSQTSSKMDSAKVPVKLVKVTRVLGRTGTLPAHRFHPSHPSSVHQTDLRYRLPRRRDPGPRRIHGRHHPQHHPQRQGPWYVPNPRLETSRRDTTHEELHGARTRQSGADVVTVRENDILCLLESEREARRLR